METVLTNEKDERFIELTKELDKEYFQIYGDIALEYQEYNDLKDPHIVLLLLNWTRPIACASYKLFDKDTIEIKRVYVKRRYRRKGIAYKLVKQLEKLAIEENFKYSIIETGSENYSAINLYKKLDYEIIDNFGQFKGDDLCICMKKEFRTLIQAF
ncbi:GNAT family N-acetyltransferase [Methanobrevibacter olleyae]|uniref:GNAT family acetyltransferase n=1 Tax=Methanobrevibacter olleyae TaxID=294671 RepID=A0A126R3G3_METOL|nr:GNAT family N-acetyltransferase [Methanobrevibacter olleyae]AMK16185.1 GNAT family acetyltransferase [Methanobrevibacter olleyae]